MRKTLGYLALVVVIICLLPLGMGYLTKSTLENSLAKYSQPGSFTMTLKSYHMGWLRSTAQITIRITNPELQKAYQSYLNNIGKSSAGAEPEFTIEEKIQHGPLVSIEDLTTHKKHLRLARGTITTSFMITPEITANLTRLLGATPTIGTLQADTIITLLGNHHTMISCKGGTFANKANSVDVKWNGYQGNIDTSSAFDKVDLSLNILGMQATLAKGNIDVSNINVTNNMIKNKQFDMWLGTGSLNMPSLSINMPDTQFSMQGLALSSSQELKGVLTDSDLKLQLEKVVVDAKTYGPVALSFSMHNLDAAAWGQLQKGMQDINKDSTLTQEERQAKYMLLMPIIVNVVSKGAEFNLENLEVNTPDGKLTVQAKINLPQQAANSSIDTLYKNAKANVDVVIPITLLSKILLQEALESIDKEKQDTAAPMAPKSPQEKQILAQQKVQQQLSGLQSSGMLVVDGSNYKLDAIYDNGKMSVNGKDIPIPVKR